jgi:hypothetical protein
LKHLKSLYPFQKDLYTNLDEKGFLHFLQFFIIIQHFL